MNNSRVFKIFAISAALCHCSLSFAHRSLVPPQHQAPTPWLTGTLLAPFGLALPKGHFVLEPYVFVNTFTGIYDENWNVQSKPNFYNVNVQFYTVIGLTKWMDFQITPQVIDNISQGQSSFHVGDLPLGFDFQLYPSDKSSWFPGVKLSLREIIPTGKYQHFDPRKKGTDEGGIGTYATNIGISFYKLYHIKDHHFLSSTLSVESLINAPVHVKGFNTYGGGPETNGTVYPGFSLATFYSIEYSFNQNWVFALDNIYLHTNKDHFSGSKGPLEKVGLPSSENISFAPAIEYNFSAHFGIIAGTWISAFGRNSIEFRSAVNCRNLDFSLW